uniref:Uncharacterized protein n=1 Tax=Phytophthora ramorum TaxID=164328 RepID=H3GXC8_PHYRM
MFSRSRSRQLLRSMFIQTEPTLNPLSVKFFPGHAVLDDRFTTGVSLCSRGNNVRLLRRGPEQHGGVELAREMVSTTHAKKLVWRDVDSEEGYDLPAVKQLDKQDEELSVTGMALDYMVSMGEIKRLLLRIRIYICRPTARWR